MEFPLKSRRQGQGQRSLHWMTDGKSALCTLVLLFSQNCHIPVNNNIDQGIKCSRYLREEFPGVGHPLQHHDPGYKS